MNTESFLSIPAGIGGGFFGGLLLGYALKKMVKLVAVIAGLFVVGFAYLQYQQILCVNWNKIESTITGLANTIINTLNNHNLENLTIANLGVSIPLIGGMSAGFAIGFMKG